MYTASRNAIQACICINTSARAAEPPIWNMQSRKRARAIFSCLLTSDIYQTVPVEPRTSNMRCVTSSFWNRAEHLSIREGCKLTLHVNVMTRTTYPLLTWLEHERNRGHWRYCHKIVQEPLGLRLRSNAHYARRLHYASCTCR